LCTGILGQSFVLPASDLAPTAVACHSELQLTIATLPAQKAKSLTAGQAAKIAKCL